MATQLPGGRDVTSWDIKGLRQKINEHGENPRPNPSAICQNIGGCFQVQGLNQSRIYLNTLKLNTSTRLNGMLNSYTVMLFQQRPHQPPGWVSFLQRLAPLFHKEQCSQGDSLSFKHLFSPLDWNLHVGKNFCLFCLHLQWLSWCQVQISCLQSICWTNGPVDAADKLSALEQKEHTSRYSNTRPQILGETEQYHRFSTVDEESPCGVLELLAVSMPKGQVVKESYAVGGEFKQASRTL